MLATFLAVASAIAFAALASLVLEHASSAQTLAVKSIASLTAELTEPPAVAFALLAEVSLHLAGSFQFSAIRALLRQSITGGDRHRDKGCHDDCRLHVSS
jgi:hypothetical protein